MNFKLKILSFALLFLTSPSLAKGINSIIAIGGGDVYGEYKNTAEAFCDVVNKSKQMNCIARITSGTVQNINIALEDVSSFGIGQEDVILEHKDKGKLKAVLRLFPEAVFLLASNNSNMFEFNDLTTQNNINIGSPLSGEFQTAKNILSLKGIEKDNFLNISRRDILTLFCKNTVDVGFIVGHNINSFVFDIMKKCNSRIISLNEEMIKQLTDSKKGYKKFTINSNSYPNQSSVINTVSTQAILFANEDMSEETVYQFLKIIFSNEKSLHFYLPFLFDFTTKGILQNTTLPHHKGVERFLKEMENSQTFQNNLI